MRKTISTRLRDQEVEIELAIVNPDPDVGLLGYGFEDESIHDLDGNVLDWELTEEEIEQINAIVDGVAGDQDDWFEEDDNPSYPWLDGSEDSAED